MVIIAFWLGGNPYFDLFSTQYRNPSEEKLKVVDLLRFRDTGLDPDLSRNRILKVVGPRETL